MKSKRIFSLVLAIAMLFSCVVIGAAKFPPDDSYVWTNLSDKQADTLLKSKSQSFIFFFYRDTCPNSSNGIPIFVNYAAKNNMTLCGLNVNEYPNWSTWAQFLEPGQYSIGFPFVIAYNSKEKLIAAQDNTYTIKKFEELLAKVNMMPGSAGAPTQGSQVRFSDVPAGSKYFEPIDQLVEAGILSGYDDGTFKPNNSITRTEAAVVIVRAGGLKTTSKSSIYSDVANDYWGKDFIMAASDAGIIKGMGDGVFAPTNNVTRIQMIKMIVCMLGKEDEANKNGGWPNGYAAVASDENIVDSTTYTKLLVADYANAPAIRGEVAEWIYKSRRASAGDGIQVGGKSYTLGMSASELGTADQVVPSVAGFSWYIFGTSTYDNFIAAGVADGKVVSLVSSGPAFEYQGFRAGQTLTGYEEKAGDFLLDKNDGDIIHGVFLIDKKYNSAKVFNDAALRGESIMNFHCTNGFRKYHKMPVYKWDDNAAEAARLHSVDMATNSYFNHTGLDGRNMAKRMTAQGVKWSSCAENIFAGNGFGVMAYNSWINSSGHRLNILGQNTHLGVGFGYNPNDTYKFYATQNFFAYASAYGAFDSFI